MYKEVTRYYDAGLNPPDDVTLLFPDDNQGNVVRLPIGNESERSGGIGVCLPWPLIFDIVLTINRSTII